MPDDSPVLIHPRRLLLVAVAFLCAGIAWGGPADKPKRDRARTKPAPKPTTQPAEPIVEPTPGTVLAERRRLNRIPRTQRSVEDIAALAGIDFLLAIGNADGARAAAMIDVVGYQQLPEGELLYEDPPRPIDPNTLAARISARARIVIGELPIESVEVRPRANLSEFTAVGLWMIAEDRALVVRASEAAPAGWVTKDACLVIRVRADRATIMGGTFFDVLPATVPPPVEPPQTPSASAPPQVVPPLPPLPPPTTRPVSLPPPADRTPPPIVSPPVTSKPSPTVQPSRTPPPTPRVATPATRPVTPPPQPPPRDDEGPPEEDK